MRAYNRRMQRGALFNFTNILFLLLAIAGAAGLAWTEGADAVIAALGRASELLLMVAPLVVAAVLISGYVQVLVPRSLMERWLGRDSGLRGLVLASVAGALTPGGPFAAFPLVVGLWKAGAAFPVCVAYLTAWSTLGVQRLLIWEIPLLGPDFATLRVVASLPLPLLGGWLAGVLLRRAGPQP